MIALSVVLELLRSMREAASCLAINGATLFEISHVLGHKTLQMVKRYSYLTEEHTADLLERNAQKRKLTSESS